MNSKPYNVLKRYKVFNNSLPLLADLGRRNITVGGSRIKIESLLHELEQYPYREGQLEPHR